MDGEGMSYIKLDRKMLEWEWFTDPATAHLWVYILLKANHKRKVWQNVVVDEGSLITSEARMSVETGLSRQQIRTAIKRLVTTKEITKVSTKTYTLLKVNKWARYQCVETSANQDENQGLNQADNQQLTSKTTSQLTTTKEDKEVKEVKKEIYKERKPTLDEVRAYCQERNNGVDPDRWFNYYTANGWKVGKNPMKDWKACVRTWEKNNPKVEEQKPSSERYKIPWLN